MCCGDVLCCLNAVLAVSERVRLNTMRAERELGWPVGQVILF